jgi:pSer/pThr/pTyr-binding forkhead associated (FHA) protein
LLGLSIGLSIGVAQVVLKEAWLLVEAGFRKGRELPLQKPLLTVGRAESCDIGLFGDAAVDRLHARIVRKGNDYLIADAGSSTGTFVNDARIEGPTPLRSGDQIRLGNSLLRFRERQKRK